MRIHIISPSPPHTVFGSQVTANRWATILHELGHSVEASQHYGGTISDLLVAMHAVKSADAVVQFHKRHAGKHSVLALTGTDVYRDFTASEKAREAMQLADRLLTFEPLAAQSLPEDLRSKVRVIYQSAERTANPEPADRDSFAVSVVGHLREDKDPLRAALAARSLPRESRIRVVQAGDADGNGIVQQAREEAGRNPRYRYLGSIPRWKARNLIAGSRLLVLSSLIESGATSVAEAVVDYVPVLASGIPGNIGLLGQDYPGYFPPGDTEALSRLLLRAETDADFYQELKTRCALLGRLFRPEREREAWAKLIKEVSRIKR